jgi:hypothetical protein
LPTVHGRATPHGTDSRYPSRRCAMKQRNLLVDIVTVLVITAAAGIAQAEETCRAKCDRLTAECKRACDDAPVPDECRANCKIADRQCMDDCTDE